MQFLTVFSITNALDKGALKREKRRKGNQKGYQNNYPLNVNPNKP